MTTEPIIPPEIYTDLGNISRPFAHKPYYLTDPIREFLRSRIQRIQAVSFPVVGVDISSWQGTIDWARMASKIYFAFIRAGRGNQDRDTLYQSNLNQAHTYGRGVGLYWYCKPNTNSNWKTHLATLVPMYKDSGSQLPPVLDAEETALSKTETTAWLQKICANFEEQTDIKPMIYTSAGWWNANTYRNDWAKQLLLWIAHWTTADAPIIPNDWGAIHNPKTWTFWQHTSKGAGADYGAASLNIDLDRYQLSLAQFNSQFGMSLKPLGEVPPPPPPPPPDEPTHDQKVERLWAYAKSQGWLV